MISQQNALELVIPEKSGQHVQEQTKGLNIYDLSLALTGTTILKSITLALPETGVTTLIGPSGAGKSSLLRCINGLQQQWQGEIYLQEKKIRQWPGGWEALRRHVGLIAQKPCVFPGSIHTNVTFGIKGWRQRRKSAIWVKQVLTQAALWDEVKERLDEPAESLSIGQQQRLCIARALAIRPSMLLLDEPTASLDPRSKQLVEYTVKSLARKMPVLCVTHDLEQAKRLDGNVVFMCEGRVIEQDRAEKFFSHPQKVESREFLQWNICECESGRGENAASKRSLLIR